jgi:hypothetical protein
LFLKINLLCHEVWSTVSRNEEAIHSGISCGLSQRILEDNKRTPCSLQGFCPSDLAVTGCGIWPPAYQDSMFCWVIVKEVESPSWVPFLEPLPQKRPPKWPPGYWLILSHIINAHMDTHQHSLSYLTVFSQCWQWPVPYLQKADVANAVPHSSHLWNPGQVILPHRISPAIPLTLRTNTRLCPRIFSGVQAHKHQFYLWTRTTINCS